MRIGFAGVHRGYDAFMAVCGIWRTAEVLRALGPARIVVDIGGGTGRLARLARDRTVVVVEPCAPMAARARRRTAAVARGDGCSLPLADGGVDAALLADVVHHVPDARRLLAEAHRVLRPGGRCVVLEFDPRQPAARLAERAEAIAFGHCRYLAPAALAAAMRAAGFATVGLRRLGRQWLATAVA